MYPKRDRVNIGSGCITTVDEPQIFYIPIHMYKHILVGIIHKKMLLDGADLIRSGGIPNIRT